MASRVQAITLRMYVVRDIYTVRKGKKKADPCFRFPYVLKGLALEKSVLFARARSTRAIKGIFPIVNCAV